MVRVRCLRFSMGGKRMLRAIRYLWMSTCWLRRRGTTLIFRYTWCVLEEVWRVRPKVRVFGIVLAGYGRRDVLWCRGHRAHEKAGE